MKLWMIIAIQSTWMSVVNIPSLGLILHLESTSGVFSTYFGYSLSHNTLRFYVFVFSIIFNTLFMYVLLWAIIKDRMELSIFQNHFCKLYEKMYVENKSTEKRAIILIFLFISFALVQCIMTVLGFGIPILNMVGKNLEPLACLLIVVEIPMSFYLMLGQFQVLILYLQLHCYIKRLMKAFVPQKMESTGLILKSAEKLYQIIQSASKLLSFQCFLMISIALVNMIFLVYMSIDLVLAPEFNLLSCIGLISGALYSGTAYQNSFD